MAAVIELAPINPLLALNELAAMQAAAKHALHDLRGNDDVLVADYAPGLVGSSGVLLDRTTGRVHILGSAYPLETYLWARDRGIRLDEPNVLVIKHVRDEEATRKALRAVFGVHAARDEVFAKLARLPVRLELDWSQTWSMLDDLRQTNAFTFEVNP